MNIDETLFLLFGDKSAEMKILMKCSVSTSDQQSVTWHDTMIARIAHECLLSTI